MGYSIAIKSGISYALSKNYTSVMTCDADGQHSFKDINKLYKLLSSNKYDIISTIRNKKNRITEHLFDLIYSKKLNVSDTLTGLKGYQINIFHKKAIKNRDSIGIEPIMIISKNKNTKVKEFKITIRERNGQSKFGGFFKANYYLLIKLFMLNKIYKSI